MTMQLSKQKDPSITFLNKYGYNVVKLPRTGIEPMDIVGRDETTLNLGNIGKIWTSTVAQPTPGPARPTAAVNGMRTDALDVSFGLDILANALAAFGATAPSLNAAYQSAHTVNFAYTNVTTTSVSPFDAGAYLASGTLQTENPQVTNYFFSEQAQAYLILDVLKSDSITITASDSHGATVGVDVPAIQAVVGANVKVKSSNASNSEITFTGPAALTFGFSVQQIARVGDKWTLHGATPSGSIAFAVPVVKPAGAPDPMIFDSGESDCRIDI
jgi:hypothetical protein